MRNLITKVEPGSIAEEVGIEVNDVLLAINDTDIEDIIDYKFLMPDEEIVLDIEKPNGEVWSYEIEKEYGEDIGLEFGGGIMDKAKRCSNKCVFCFIDQNPKGMRESLYFKDDDSRLSFLQGNFVTLTNMSDADIDRIIKYKISPINISVHTTNPELRVNMLKNRFAGAILERLEKLKEAEIEMHAQVVLMPGLNDGEELKRTINELYTLRPYVKNIAVVPLGITKHREGLEKLSTYTKEAAKKELLMVKEFQEKYIKEIGSPFVRLSDEFYIVSDVEVPEDEFYNGYEQLEDGVGMIRYFRDRIERDVKSLNKNVKGSFSLVTGVLAFDEISRAANLIKDTNPNIDMDVFRVINNFYGETITVAGLLTGKDIKEQLKGKLKTEYLIMPNNMFRKGYELGPKEQIMLDNSKIEDLEKALGIKVIVCDYTGDDLIDIINKHCKEEI